nr:MAG TPA: hypothetical protein [Caudoviricetes sp.]
MRLVELSITWQKVFVNKKIAFLKLFLLRF